MKTNVSCRLPGVWMFGLAVVFASFLFETVADANDVTSAQMLSVSNGVATVGFFGTVGNLYIVQRTTSLTPPNWIPILFTNAPVGNLFQVQDDFSDLGGQPDQSYYRLLEVPAGS